MGPDFVNVGSQFGGLVTRAEYERILNERIRQNFRASPAPSSAVPYESRVVNVNGQWVTPEQLTQLRNQALAETRSQAASPSASAVPYEQRTINVNGQQVTPAQLTQMRDAAIRETWKNAASPPQAPRSSLGPLNSTALPGGGGSLSTPINRGAVPTAPVNLAPAKAWTALPPLEPGTKPPVVRLPQGAGGNLGPALGALGTALQLPGAVGQAFGDARKLQSMAFDAGRNNDLSNLAPALAMPFTALPALAGVASNIPRPANIPPWAWPFPDPPGPNDLDPAALEPGPVIDPGEPSPVTGGQLPGVSYLIFLSVINESTGVRTTTQYGPRQGPITITRQGTAPTAPCASGTSYSQGYVLNAPGPFLAGGNGCYAYDPAWTVTTQRVDGQPDTGGNQPGGVADVRAPNPARQPNVDPQPLPPPRVDSPQPSDLPWPQTPTPHQPTPLTPINPSGSPSDAPRGFNPPSGDPESVDQPDTPEEESTPDNPTQTPPRLRPSIIPIVIGAGAGIGLAARSGSLTGGSPFLSPVNRSNTTGLVDTPVRVPSGSEQPAITPSGPQIGTPPNDNPNIEPNTPPVEQAPNISGNCCIPPPDPEILKRLEQIKKGIGVDGLPASVPDQIAKQNPVQESVGSLAELHLWQVKQLDGVMGRWPQQIPIPTPAGPVNVGMPNMAEAVAEMVGMMVSQQVTAAQILNTSSRTLAQAGSATQQAHLAHLTAKANADFLGYESRSNAVDMPLAYTPGADPFDGFLNESVAKIQGFQNADGQDVKQIFAELLQAAAIIRAVYWRRLDPKGNLKQQIQENIKGGANFVDRAAAGGNDNDWEAYLKQVEEGFRGATGDDTPYGRNQSEGPKIKDRSPKKDKD